MTRRSKFGIGICVGGILIAFSILMIHFLTYDIFLGNVIGYDFNQFVKTHNAQAIEKVTQQPLVTKYLVQHRTDKLIEYPDVQGTTRSGGLYVVGAYRKSMVTLTAQLDVKHSNFLLPRYNIVKIDVMPPWD